MSNKNRVNPDHYKVAGRDPQGEDFTPDLNRQAFGRETARLRDGRTAIANFIPGAAPVGEAPPNGAVRGSRGAPSRKAAPVAGTFGKEEENGRRPGHPEGAARRRGGAKKAGAKKTRATAGARKTVGRKAPAKKAGSARRSTRSR
jgi:hypothetical protein